jgi:hypothetical protein
MSGSSGELIIGEALLLEVEQAYSVSVSIRGISYGLLVARHTEANGIRCIAGHDILRSAEPDFNFYSKISEAIMACDQLGSRLIDR